MVVTLHCNFTLIFRPIYKCSNQRRILIQLLIKADDPEFQYLAYLLYDLLSSENDANNIDTQEQTILFDSLPWTIKKYFRDAMKTTIKYTKNRQNTKSLQTFTKMYGV